MFAKIVMANLFSRLRRKESETLTIATAKKWQMQYDHECQSLTWLSSTI